MAPCRSKKSRRQSRRQKQTRRQKQSRRQTRRSQRGGSGCAAFGNNYAPIQKGGMAPFNYENALALGDAATRVQAQANNLDHYIATSQALADKFGTPMFHGGLNQKGGRRTRRQRKQRNQRKQQHGGPYRQQRGGNWHELQKFDAPYTSGFPDSVTGVNPQFRTEASVNSQYAENRGPQF